MIEIAVPSDVVINVTPEVAQQRTTICSSCQYYTPAGNVNVEIFNAVTGQVQTSSVYRFEDCSQDNILPLVGFIELVSSVCPEGKWQ